jgi:hypothetical protein
MSRRIALAFSLALTVVVSFAVASFATQAGWLQAQSDPEVANADNSSPQPVQPTDFMLQEPVVITEYVYEDIPVVVSRAAEGEPNAAVTPNPPPVLVNAQDTSSERSNSPDSASTSAQATQVDQAPQVLSWSHDDDGDDHEDFEDEIQDRQREQEREAEHHEREHEHEEEDD